MVRFFFARALVAQDDLDTGVQERQLPQAFGENLVVELNIGERVRRGLEANHRARLFGFTGNGQRRLGNTVLIALFVALSTTPNR